MPLFYLSDYFSYLYCYEFPGLGQNKVNLEMVFIFSFLRDNSNFESICFFVAWKLIWTKERKCLRILFDMFDGLQAQRYKNV